MVPNQISIPLLYYQLLTHIDLVCLFFSLFEFVLLSPLHYNTHCKNEHCVKLLNNSLACFIYMYIFFIYLVEFYLNSL